MAGAIAAKLAGALDTLTLGDALAVSAALHVAVVDVLSLSETAGAVGQFDATVADTLSLSDLAGVIDAVLRAGVGGTYRVRPRVGGRFVVNGRVIE